MELGVYMFLGYAFQAIGLENIQLPPAPDFFYLNVKLVPFFSFLIFFGKRIQASTWISALVAFCGTALLTLDGSGDDIAAACASAMFILRTEAASKAVSKSSELNAASLWTVCCLSVIWTFVITLRYIEGGELVTTAQMIGIAIRHTVDSTLPIFIDHPLQMLYLSAVTTTLANYIQSKGHKDISANEHLSYMPWILFMDLSWLVFSLVNNLELLAGLGLGLFFSQLIPMRCLIFDWWRARIDHRSILSFVEHMLALDNCDQKAIFYFRNVKSAYDDFLPSNG